MKTHLGLALAFVGLTALAEPIELTPIHQGKPFDLTRWTWAGGSPGELKAEMDTTAHLLCKFYGYKYNLMYSWSKTDPKAANGTWRFNSSGGVEFCSGCRWSFTWLKCEK